MPFDTELKEEPQAWVNKVDGNGWVLANGEKQLVEKTSMVIAVHHGWYVWTRENGSICSHNSQECHFQNGNDRKDRAKIGL